MLAEGAPLLGGRVAGAHADRDVRGLPAEPLRGEPDARHGCPQVAVDVVDQRLEGRHIQHPEARQRVVGRGLTHEPVEAPQERSECLAAAGGRTDERVPAGRDGGPALCLWRCR